MSGVVLDAAAIRGFARPAGNDPIVVALRNRQYQRTLRGVAAIRDTLAAEASELSESSGFFAAFAHLSATPAVLQRQILGYPASAFWVDVALDLLRRRAHVRFPELHIAVHLEAFGRIALAAAAESGGSFSCLTRTDSAGRLCLSGTRSYYVLEDAKPFERVCVKITDGRLRAWELGGGREYVAKYCVIPCIGTFELNAVDEELRLPGRYDFTFDLPFRDSDLIRWRSPLQESARWIATADPALATEIEASVRTIVPVRSQSPEVHVSATFKEAPGLMTLSWTPDTPVLTEALVHEYHHGKLNTLLAADPLIAGPTGDSIYYSPWRPDPRPLLGLLHGSYVFHAVLEFWLKFLDARLPLLHETRLRHRLCLVQRQTAQALDTLVAEADLTEAGSILVRHLLVSTRELQDRLATDSSVCKRVERTTAIHREQWNNEHGGRREGRPAIVPSNDTANEGSTSAVGIRNISMQLLCEQFPANDSLIEELAVAEEQGIIDAVVQATVQECQEMGEPLLEMLVRAHAAYVSGAFEDAGARYGVLVQHYPFSRYFWQCFAHSLRHLGQVEPGTRILTHIGQVAATARSVSGDLDGAIRERVDHAMTIVVAPTP